LNLVRIRWRELELFLIQTMNFIKIEPIAMLGSHMMPMNWSMK